LGGLVFRPGGNCDDCHNKRKVDKRKTPAKKPSEKKEKPPITPTIA